MKVVVDGVVYTWQTHGGISRMFREILPRICDLDSSIQITLTTTHGGARDLPHHSRIRHHPPLGMRAWWQARRGIWHSTYYTRPAYGVRAEVVTVVDMVHERLADRFVGADHDRFRARKRDCILNADAIICISEATRQDVLALCPPATDNIHVVALAQSEEFALLHDRLDAAVRDRPFVLYVGDRQGAHKNFGAMLAAYSEWARGRDIDLVLAGQSLNDAERQDLARRDIVSRVHVYADPSDSLLARLYNQALMFVYPSLYEGFGIPLLEAMASGCPVVASRIPSSQEVAGDAAIYFEPDDTRSLTAALEVGLGARADLARVQLGLDRVRRYSWDAAAAGTLAAYRSICQ